MMSRQTPATVPTESTISDQALGQLSHLERADLLRRLQELSGSEFALSQHLLTARRWFIALLAVCCVALIPWTIGLGLTLPRTYVAANWQVLWTGFDVVLLSCLAVTAWSLWKHAKSCYRRRSSRASCSCATRGSTCSPQMDTTNSS